MKYGTKRPPTFSVRRTRSLIQAALAPGVQPPELNLKELRGSSPSLVRSLPAWVKRFGLLAGGAHTCLWCDPRPAAGDTFPSQMVINLPRGRYLIDTLDIESGTWVSRESAEGGPLVAGLTYTGGPVLVWIRSKRN